MDGRPGAALRTGPGSHNPTARGKIQPCRDGPCAPLTVPWILSSTSRSANHDDGASYLRWVGRVDGTAALAAARGLKDYGTPKEDVHYDYRRPVGRRRQLPCPSRQEASWPGSRREARRLRRRLGAVMHGQHRVPRAAAAALPRPVEYVHPETSVADERAGEGARRTASMSRRSYGAQDRSVHRAASRDRQARTDRQGPSSTVDPPFEAWETRAPRTVIKPRGPAVSVRPPPAAGARPALAQFVK
jgi:hypothetical protein